MAEWLIAPVLKTGVPQGIGGSNPSPSAKRNYGIIQLMKKIIATAVCMAMAGASVAATVVDVNVTGRAKTSVEIGVQNQAFARCLGKNLELSGLFSVGPSGAVKVSGVPGAIKAEGAGKSLNCPVSFSDDRSARMVARQLSDAMVAAWSGGGQKGFALDKIIFLDCGKSRGAKTARPSELCETYPDGYDIRRLTSDGKMTVFPRWQADGESIIYISDKGGAPQIWQMNTKTGTRSVKFSFKGTPAGVAVSPDGSKIAAILSFQGNPELYVLQGGNYTRLTNTPLASEGQPTWSPDGRQIAYVSDETRHPQIYVVDGATRQKRRLTSRGSMNFDPDWGADGRIAYITRRGAAQVAVMSPNSGDASAQLVTEQSNWEHPSWSRDGRHLVANRDRSLFLIDTLEGGDKPRRLFTADGNWISPCWKK